MIRIINDSPSLIVSVGHTVDGQEVDTQLGAAGEVVITEPQVIQLNWEQPAAPAEQAAGATLPAEAASSAPAGEEPEPAKPRRR
jgi:hypothetical protein